MLAMTPQNRLGFRVITSGPGTMPWMVIAPTISAITAFGRDPQGEQGDERGLRPGVVRRLGPGHALDGPSAEAARVAGELLLQRVGGERPEHRPVPGEDAQHRAQQRPSDDGTRRLAELRTDPGSNRPMAGRAPRRAPDPP